MKFWTITDAELNEASPCAIDFIERIVGVDGHQYFYDEDTIREVLILDRFAKEYNVDGCFRFESFVFRPKCKCPDLHYCRAFESYIRSHAAFVASVGRVDFMVKICYDGQLKTIDAEFSDYYGVWHALNTTSVESLLIELGQKIETERLVGIIET